MVLQKRDLYIIYHNNLVRPREKETEREGGGEYLEEVDLHGTVGEVEDDGRLGSEPVAEVRQTGQLVSVTRRDVGARLQKVLRHVVTEVLQQRDLGRAEVTGQLGSNPLTDI